MICEVGSAGDAPLVSVIIPAYEAAASIGRAIESVQAQSLEDLEIIVVDDGSGDDTAAVVERYAALDPRLSLSVLGGNRGAAHARNHGMDQARGRWLAFLDADDSIQAGRLARLVTLGQDNGADLVADNIRYRESGSGRDLGTGLMERAPHSISILSAADFVQGNRFLVREFKLGYLKPIYRRDFLARYGLRQRERLAVTEDYHFCLDCLLRGARYLVTDEALYDYSVTPGSLSKSFSIDHLWQLEALNQDYLAGEAAQGSGELRQALIARQRSIELNIGFMRFVAFLKAGAVFSACHIFATRPALAPYLWIYGLESLGKRVAAVQRAIAARRRNRTPASA